MQVAKTFARTRFNASVISEALAETRKISEELARGYAAEHEAKSRPYSLILVPESLSLTVNKGDEHWTYDELDDWLGAYERENSGANFSSNRYSSLSVSFDAATGTSRATVSAPRTHQVEKVLGIFRRAEPSSKLPDPPLREVQRPPVVVFIGHGRSSDWRAVKDHLQDKHHYKVDAYEVGSRAGHTIRDVLSTMLNTSTFALLMMTAGDETLDGQKRPRQNVVHETGLFQGKLGFNRAVAVVEEGVEVFSNLDGVQQVRYKSGHVESTFGDILAALRREFGDR